MTDKRVATYDFSGIKVGMLVRIDKTWQDGASEIALVLDHTIYTHMIGEGENESYDPMIIVLTNLGRRTVPVDAVSLVSEKDDDR